MEVMILSWPGLTWISPRNPTRSSGMSRAPRSVCSAGGASIETTCSCFTDIIRKLCGRCPSTDSTRSSPLDRMMARSLCVTAWSTSKCAPHLLCLHCIRGPGSSDRSLSSSSDLLQNPLIVPVKVLRGHNITRDLGVLDVVFHPTQPWVFSSGADSTIRLYT